MKSKTLFALFFFAAIFLIIAACNKDENLPYRNDFQPPNLPQTLHNYSDITLPASFGTTSEMIKSEVTDATATLGRVLFYDVRLSLNNKTSCGSCHLQEFAFSDPVRFSEGFNGGKTTRNSSTIINPVMENEFFWDIRISELEHMVLEPIQNHVEMGMEKLDDLTEKLNSQSYYAPLFEQAFGDSEITENRIAEALSQFLKSMVSYRSKTDEGALIQFANFTELEKDGRYLFLGSARCYFCHSGTNFNEGFGTSWHNKPKVANIGLDAEYADKGIGEYDPDRIGEFKVPSLRNIALTAPYMHDGRYQTLEEVVEHYNSGIQDHPNLDERLRWGTQPMRLNLSEYQKDALVAYLKTLTDNKIIRGEKFSNPFE